ncbi:hypothetical protein N2W52_002050 [Clostridium perfringens]|nr:hypothetical protein [Clostridium perfringens]MDK0983067.1 hypothetical protein [Clostridium perfringens]
MNRVKVKPITYGEQLKKIIKKELKEETYCSIKKIVVRNENMEKRTVGAVQIVLISFEKDINVLANLSQIFDKIEEELNIKIDRKIIQF